jgi:transposase
VALILTAGHDHESPVFATVLAHVPQPSALTHVIMDKAYDSDQIRAQLTAQAMVPVIPPKSNRTVTYAYDKALYKLREKVERFFNALKQFRRIATRYEKLSQTFLAFIHLVAAWIIIK